VADDSARPVRVRFAPSPTGSLHIGGLRTALFNWLFARHYNGSFILRIEDTDQKRFDPSALQTLMEALRWAGLQWDEGPEVGGDYGPYVQSERLSIYQEWARWLVEHDKAYYAYETPEELAKARAEAEAQNLPRGYNRAHRNLTDEERAAFEREGRPRVVRLKMPLDGVTQVPDLIHGEVSFDNSTQQDAVLLKADGFPTYHLAHVVDDYLMKISHVLRAVEWMPSLPVHWQLWQAFGWEPPIYAHLPVMLNPNGKGKISKRHPPVDSEGNVIPVMVHDYIRGGYIPEGVVNFLANTGWSYGEDIEVFDIQDAIARFDGTRIMPSNSAFPVDKLKWLNAEHIRRLPVDELARRLRRPLEEAGLKVDAEILMKITPLVQTRIKTLNDVVGLAGFFFREEFIPAPPEKLPQKRMDVQATRVALQQSIDVLRGLDDFTMETTLPVIEKLTQPLGLSNSQLFGVLRTAVTGQQVSPPLFETMEVIGKAETLRRLELALHSLNTAERVPSQS
jgi:glutamyl-tRNA synthetase